MNYAQERLWNWYLVCVVRVIIDGRNDALTSLTSFPLLFKSCFHQQAHSDHQNCWYCPHYCFYLSRCACEPAPQVQSGPSCLVLSPTWLSPHGSWEESDVAAGGSGELPASGCPAGRRDCTQLVQSSGWFLCWLFGDGAWVWQVSWRRHNRRCTAMGSETVGKRNTSPSQSSQNQEASSCYWRQKDEMRYKAHLVYPKTASLEHFLFIAPVLLCPCSKISSKPSFFYIYHNETPEFSFQCFHSQLAFSRGTEQFWEALRGDTSFQKGHSSAIIVLKSK